MSAFDRAARGDKELVLVTGLTGIGKTSLVKEICRPVTERRGYFISGKFDQFQRNTPYTAIVEAFRDLVRQLLTESDARLAHWREKLIEALGPNGQLIVDVVPEIELIIGPQPPVPDVGPTESRNRFNIAFGDFIRVFCSPHHPLVLFLDDLQWADAASVKLLEIPLTDENTRFLLVVEAYRDNEVEPTHFVNTTLEALRNDGCSVNRVVLGNLGLKHLIEFIGDTLHIDVDEAQPLAELMEVKTTGNPFFLKECLNSLKAEGLLEFDSTAQAWQWDLEKIRTRQIADEVFDLPAGKVRKLEPRTQEVLKLAACIGNQFDLETLSTVHEKPPQESLADLWEAVREGMVWPMGEAWKFVALDVPQFVGTSRIEFKFSHDRIQEASYSLISPSHRKTLHRKIGERLLEKYELQGLDERIFDIVYQLNSAGDLLGQSEETRRLARLNLVAGVKAKRSSAYHTALSYLDVGIGLLNTDDWENHYQFVLDLHVQGAEAAHLAREFKRMDELVETILLKGRTLLDKEKAYGIKIQALIERNRNREAIKTARLFLRDLGFNLPERPTKIRVLMEFLRTKWMLAGKSADHMLELPRMRDPEKLAVSRILSVVASAAYVTVPEFVPLIACRLVNLSIRYGNSPATAYACMGFGLMLCELLGRIRGGGIGWAASR